jgi:hypothetical protein
LKRGYSHTQIAERLGISTAQVSRDISSLVSEARVMIQQDRCKKEARQHLEELVDQVDEVQQEAWETWDWSKGRLTESLRNQLLQALVESKGELPDYVQLRLTKMPDPVYLRTVLNCIGAKAKLLGLESPNVSVSLSQNQSLGLNWDQLVQRPDVTPAQLLEERIQLGGNPPSPKPNGASNGPVDPAQA